MSTLVTSTTITAIAPTALVVNIKDIKGSQLPDVGWRKRSGNFYVKLVVDGHLKHQTVIAKGNTASWMESFYIETLGSSVLECQVYAQRKVLSNDFIGKTNDKIETLLTESSTGLVVRELCKSDGKSKLREPTTIEFSITAIAKDAFGQPKPTPSSPERVQIADVANNIIQSTEAITDAWDPFIAKVKRFTDMVDKISEVHPYAKIAWGILSATYRIVIAQKDRDDCIIRLIKVMDDVYSFVNEAEPVKKIESHSRVVTLMTQQATECAYFIRDYTTNKSFWKRTLKNTFLSDVDEKIQGYENKFKELQMAFQGHAVLQTGITVSRVLDNLDSLAVDLDLSDMPYATGARFDPEKGCLSGTREGIIGEIIQWINSPDGDDVPRIFFLTGVAGSGKSALAHTIAQQFYQLERLGSSFCFDDADLANRNPRNLFSTMTLDIGDLDHQWKKSLCGVVKGNRSLRTTLAATEQFRSFILGPAKTLTTIGPIVIVIDALDESGGQSARKALLDIFAKRVPELPSNFRILLTSRPEKDIVAALNGHRHVLCRDMDTIDKASNEADITLYVKSQLSGIRSLELEWPNQRWCRMLVESSDGLFQWAFTACRAVKDRKGGIRPAERLNLFVSSKQGLDGLYSKVLSQAFEAEDPTAMSRFKVVMGRILATKEPLSISAHSELRADDEPADLVELIVQQLGLLLSGVNQLDVPIRALHSSFFDFLKDQNRSKSYYVDPSQYHQSLALSSLRVMESGLHFNICSLETSHHRNADVADLTARVKGAILPHLSYACHFWADHLSQTAYDTTTLDAVSNFLHNHFLHWLEVLSLTKNIDVALRMLQSILEWNQDNNANISSFAKDAIKFVAVFGPPIAQSTPHIYLSALPFSPRQSLVAQHYLPQFPDTLQLKIGQADNWQKINILVHAESVNAVGCSHSSKHIISGSGDNTIKVWDIETGNVIRGPLEGHTGYITSVAFSQDGKHIVSGSADKTIRVWDAETGDIILGPLEGHSDLVTSLAISHDGNYIVSGSTDMTIRVWDMETGGTVVGPLEGHSGPVNSVTISYDGRFIVSGSDDMTIRVWNTMTGDTVVGPMKGHTGCVSSVAISHDGKHIVSGSDDRTIRIWNTETGDIAVGPLKGHTGSINSVAISSDDKWIVSGSSDQTIRIWDVETGETVAGPLEGHTNIVNDVVISHDGNHIVSGSDDKTIRVWDVEFGQGVKDTGFVNSVTVSHDGKYIVSGSSDKTIHMWDVETGDAIVGPLEGHTSCVNSVAISHDGNYIVSGSTDMTIRVWDMETGDTVVGPLEGHSGPVNSVTISHDGKFIVSGSDDMTIRVWNTKTGDTIVGPLKGHTGSISSVAISHDGKWIVSGSADQTICVWDVKTGDIALGPLKGHTGSVNSVAFSHDHKLIASGSDDKTMCVWDAETGDHTVGPLEHASVVKSVAISHDGRHIVSGSHDATICVWDAETSALVIGPLEGHSDSVNSVAISNDGKHVVSSSGDKMIRVWDIAAGGTAAGSDFKDSSRLSHGWILNPPSTLLFWVPSWNRTGLWWPRNSAVIGKSSTRLDLQNFVHGNFWHV